MIRIFFVVPNVLLPITTESRCEVTKGGSVRQHQHGAGHRKYKELEDRKSQLGPTPLGKGEQSTSCSFKTGDMQFGRTLWLERHS